MGKPKMKIVTIRPADEDEREAIRYVMRESGCGHASQAMIFACHAYRTMNERNKPLLNELQRKYHEHNRQQQKVIHGLQAENHCLKKKLEDVQRYLMSIMNMIGEIPSGTTIPPEEGIDK